MTKNLRDELKTLREQFEQAQKEEAKAALAAKIAPANQFLNKLADNLVSLIKEKVSHGEVQRIIVNDNCEPIVRFESNTLDVLSAPELAALYKADGYARLIEVCARPDVDMCLGR